VVFSVTQVTAFDEVLKFTSTESTSWIRKLEWPKEIVDLLEVWSNGKDFMDNIFNADDTIFAKLGLNDSIVAQWNALLVDLSVTTLVDQFTDGFEVGVTVSDIWLNDSQHLDGSLGQLHEDTIVDLEKTEELQGFALLGVDLVDTLDTNDKGELWFSRDVERAIRFCNASKSNLLSLLIAVFLYVGFSTLENSLSLLLVGLLSLLGFSGSELTSLLLRLSLFQNGLWSKNVILGWNAC